MTELKAKAKRRRAEARRYRYTLERGAWVRVEGEGVTLKAQTHIARPEPPFHWRPPNMAVILSAAKDLSLCEQDALRVQRVQTR